MSLFHLYGWEKLFFNSKKIKSNFLNSKFQNEAQKFSTSLKLTEELRAYFTYMVGKNYLFLFKILKK